MSESVDWGEMRHHLDALYTASGGLERLFPGRKFTLDGHLVGSVGEVIAAYMFGLTLLPASNRGHDALAGDGRRVEIKLTQGTTAAIRHLPAHLIVLHRPKGGPVEVVYNGPGEPAWNAAGKIAANGQKTIGIAKLAKLNRMVTATEKLFLLRPPPI